MQIRERINIWRRRTMLGRRPGVEVMLRVDIFPYPIPQTRVTDNINYVSLYNK